MNFNDYTLSELQSYVWDYYKDVHGFRPRHLDLTTREECLAVVDLLNDRMDNMMATEEGRQQLREEGWSV